MFDFAFRSVHDTAAMILTAGLMFAAFAIAHLCAIAFPPVDEKTQRITVVTSRLCLLVLIVCALWFASAAFDYMKFTDIFRPTRMTL